MNSVPLHLLEESMNTIRSSFSELLKVKSDKCLEIEARLGMLVDRKSGARIDLGAAHPVIFTSQKSEFYFQSGVSSSFFQNIYKGLSNLEASRVEEVVVIKNRIRTTYSDGKKSLMRKIRLRTFEIHFPRCQYDVRMSFSKEEVLEKEAGIGVSKSMGAGFRRERDRVSMPTDFYKFDLTSIKSADKFIYEVEVEVIDFGFDRNEFFSILENIAK